MMNLALVRCCRAADRRPAPMSSLPLSVSPPSPSPSPRARKERSIVSFLPQNATESFLLVVQKRLKTLVYFCFPADNETPANLCLGAKLGIPTMKQAP